MGICYWFRIANKVFTMSLDKYVSRNSCLTQELYHTFDDLTVYCKSLKITLSTFFIVSCYFTILQLDS